MHMFSNPEPNMGIKERLKIVLIVHWRGFACVLVPILCVFTLLPLPAKKDQWTAYCLLVMAIFWVTECIPLPVTSFLPLIVFPLTGVMSTTEVCKCFVNDSIFMFIGSLILAASVEQSGLHKRMALIAIRSIGYSHEKLLVAIVGITTFVSMWITNTAATTMMVPIVFDVLKVFENQNLLKIFEDTESGEKVASDITTCYFCTVTFAATIGGIGTLIGTATNLVFKGLFVAEFPRAPEFLSFPLFSAFTVPYMIALDVFMILYILVQYVGFLRPNSDAAKRAKISNEALEAAKRTVNRDYAALGGLTFWEFMVLLLFGGAMVSFFCRTPKIFYGWGDFISDYFKLNNPTFVRDSALAGLVTIVMLVLPSKLSILDSFKAKVYQDMPNKRIPSVLNWRNLMADMPFSFIFLLGGGFALSTAAKNTGLNAKIGETLQGLKVLPQEVVLLIIITVIVLVTNLASNIAVANVFTPISMQLALRIRKNPLWYALASGLSASFCFMLPVGTPGNLIVKSVAKVPTIKMMKAGLGPTISTIIVTWLALIFYAPLVWPVLSSNDRPAWVN